jgi:hypothetical protein
MVLIRQIFKRECWVTVFVDEAKRKTKGSYYWQGFAGRGLRMIPLTLEDTVTKD